MSLGILRAGATLLFPLLLCASSVPRLSVEELAARSDTILRGRVVRAWAAMDSENRFIWTHYELQVTSTLKGQPAGTVEIAEPGGTLNGVTLLAPGATEYAVGEETAVFVYRTPIGYLRTTNYGEGKFTISADGRMHAATGISIAGATFNRRTPAPPRGAGVEGLDGMSWSAFQSRVTRIVAAGIVAAGKGVRR
jgi:hypothetical protein